MGFLTQRRNDATKTHSASESRGLSLRRCAAAREILFNRLQLYSGSTRVKSRQRDRKFTDHIDLAQDRTRNRMLQRGHVAVCHEVSAQAREAL